jgi:polyisoprenoid-binding protein YceI
MMLHLNENELLRGSKLCLTTLALSLVLAACGGGEPAAEAITPPPAETTLPGPTQVLPDTPPPAEAVETQPDETMAEAAEEPLEAPATTAEDAAAEFENVAEAEAETTGEVRTFRIIAEQSEASYQVEEEFFGRKLGLITAIGRTRAIEGEFQVEFQDDEINLAGGRFVVDLRTLTSDERRRDQRIREQWLESNTYPFAEFSPMAIEGFPAGAAEGQAVSFKISGEMTIRQITIPLTFETTARLDGETLTGAATTRLFMRDFGFDPPEILGMLKVTDGVDVRVQFMAQETSEGS